MLKTGYNLVRGRALEEFRGDVTRRYGLSEPITLSAIALLRAIRCEQPLPQAVVQVTGFPDLWRACPDADGLARTLFRLLSGHMNWLQGRNYYIYFAVSDEVTFQNTTHLYLRSSAELRADMTAVFGHMTQESSDHYHHNFNVSQV
jgi:hypothetical protein